MSKLVWNGRPIRSWAAFERLVKRPDRKLLSHLSRYPDAIFVAGCQRSGTTALARMLKRAPGMGSYEFGRDDELDAALMLCGYVSSPVEGRCCFQTTYLNDHFGEYFENNGFRLIWVIREPLSVVYSMLHNWKRGALRRLYSACGSRSQVPAPGLFGNLLGPSRLEMACASYVGKTVQIHELAANLTADRFMAIDYDDLVLRKDEVVPKICRFLDLDFDESFLDAIHTGSVSRGNRFTPQRAAYVNTRCRASYEQALSAIQ